MNNLIKVERARRNMTQNDLALEMGVNRQTINSIETKKYIPSLLLGFRIAHFFKMPADDLFELEEDEY